MVKIVIFAFSGRDVGGDNNNNDLIMSELKRRGYNKGEMDLSNITIIGLPSNRSDLHNIPIYSDHITPFSVLDSVIKLWLKPQQTKRNHKEDSSWIEIDDGDIEQYQYPSFSIYDSFMHIQNRISSSSSSSSQTRNFNEELSWIKIDFSEFEMNEEEHAEKEYPYFPFSIYDSSFIQIPNIPSSSSQTRNFNEELSWIKECIVK